MTSRADLIEVGCYVFARGVSDEAIFDGDATGGVVVSVDTHVDGETGEVQRQFSIARAHGPRRVRWGRLRADQVGEVHPPSSATVRSLFRAIERCAAERKGPLSSDDRRDLEALTRLFEAIG